MISLFLSFWVSKYWLIDWFYRFAPLFSKPISKPNLDIGTRQTFQLYCSQKLLYLPLKSLEFVIQTFLSIYRTNRQTGRHTKKIFLTIRRLNSRTSLEIDVFWKPLIYTPVLYVCIEKEEICIAINRGIINTSKYNQFICTYRKEGNMYCNKYWNYYYIQM